MKACMIWMLLLFTATVGTALPPDDTAGSESVLRDPVLSFFSSIQSRHPEKLYLHLNQPYYGAGDTIWFKAYLADAVSHRPDTLSNFIYVDLADRRGEFVLAKKIKRDSLGFANCLPLPDTLPAGEYTLRAYTGWMLNFDPAFFYRRNITVGNTRSDRVRTDITYTSAQAVVRFADADGRPIRDAGADYELFDRNGKRIEGVRQRTSATGALFVDLPHDSIRNGGYIRMKLDEGGTVFRRTLFLEPEALDFAVQFFPEGGELVAGVPRLVAFKAERSDGYPADVQGIVVNDSGDTLTTFGSEHDGMGAFLLCPESGETYRAVCRSGEQTVTTPLPAVEEDACALTAVQAPGRILYKADGTVPRGSRLVGHIRGDCCCIAPVDPQRPAGTILTDSLPEGILHLLLVDSTGRPRSERLVFVNKPGNRERWTVTPEKPRYGKREKVRIEIGLKDAGGKPIESDLSVSVTDRRAVRYDSLGDDIRTNLLLCSDIEGYVHNPGYYFRDDDPVREHRLDLVMMTNGWRRFNTRNLYQPEPFTPRHFIERGQYLSGKVIGIAGRAAPEASVSAVALNRENLADAAQADDSGRFVLSGLDFTDTVLFMVSAKTRRGKPTQRIDMDRLYPKPPLTERPPFPDSAESVRKTVGDYLQQQKLQYAMIDGAKVYELEGVEVTAADPQKPRSGVFATVYDTANLAKYERLPLYNALSILPGIRKQFDFSTGQAVFCLKNRTGLGYVAADIIINGRRVPSDFLYRYDMLDVEFIRLVRDMPTINNEVEKDGFKITEKGATGEKSNFSEGYHIEIYLKPSAETGKPDFQLYRTIGYAETIEFYHPVYDTPEEIDNGTPDERTTLYWNPYVETDSGGNTTIEFYTNDSEQADYDITIEGLNPEGTAYRYRRQLCN